MNVDIMILFFLMFFPVGVCIYSIFYLIYQGNLGKLPLSWKYWVLLLFAYGGNIFFFIYAYVNIVYDFQFVTKKSWLEEMEVFLMCTGFLFANYILYICLEEVKRTWERIGHIHHKRYEYIKKLPISFAKKFLLFIIGYMLFLIALMSLKMWGYI